MPVREAIHRSHEKAKQMNMLKQRHEQALAQQGGMRGGYPGGGYQPAGMDSTKRRKTGAGAGRKPDPRQMQVRLWRTARGAKRQSAANNSASSSSIP